MQREHRNALLLLHLTVLIWGLTGIFGRLITQPADQLVYTRTVIALVGLAVASPIMGFPLLPNRADLKHHLLTGFIIAGHWVTFYGGIKLATVSVAVTCLSASTIFTALIAPLWNRERVKGFEIALGLVVIAAIGLIFGFESEHRLGILVATCSALLSAVFTVINGQLIKRDHAGRIGFYEIFGVTLLTGAWLAFDGSLPPPLWELPNDQIVYHLILGLLCTSFAFVADIVIAEPKALIGFAGPRVIEQTVREKLPEGFQRAEFLLQKGAIDRIVDRRKLPDELAEMISLLMQPARA